MPVGRETREFIYRGCTGRWIPWLFLRFLGPPQQSLRAGTRERLGKVRGRRPNGASRRYSHAHMWVSICVRGYLCVVRWPLVMPHSRYVVAPW